MPDLDLSELRRQIGVSSPKNGPGRVVKLERGYAKALLAEIDDARMRTMSIDLEIKALRKCVIERRHFHLFVEALAEIKTTVDGESDQSVAAIITGLLAEMAERDLAPASIQEPADAL